MAEAAAESSGAALNSDMMRDWKRRNIVNMKRIREACDNQPDIQAIVMNEIDRWEEARGESTESLGALIVKTQKEKKARREAHLEEEQDWLRPPDGDFERWQLGFKKWGPQLITHLAMYCDEGLHETADSPVWKQSLECTKLLIFGWDVQAEGEATSYAMYSNKAAQFDLMRDAYEKKRHRLRALRQYLLVGSIDWGTCGHYALEIEEDTRTLKLSCGTFQAVESVTIPHAAVPEAAIEQASVNGNWSIRGAVIMAPGIEPVACKNFFPLMERKLTKTPSGHGDLLLARTGKKGRKQDTQGAGSGFSPQAFLTPQRGVGSGVGSASPAPLHGLSAGVAAISSPAKGGGKGPAPGAVPAASEEVSAAEALALAEGGARGSAPNGGTEGGSSMRLQTI